MSTAIAQAPVPKPTPLPPPSVRVPRPPVNNRPVRSRAPLSPPTLHLKPPARAARRLRREVPTEVDAKQGVTPGGDSDESRAAAPGTAAAAQRLPSLSLSKQTTQSAIVPRPAARSSAAQPAVATPAVATPAAQKAAPNLAGSAAAAPVKSPKVNDGSVSLNQIAAAPESPLRDAVVTQSQLINKESLRSESQLSRTAATRKQQIGSYFSNARRGLSEFISKSVAGTQTFIAKRQAELIGVANRTLQWVRSTVMGMMQSAQALASQFRARVNQMLEGMTASIQSRVEGIAGQITGLINSVPLPDLPGISQIRSAAVGLLSRAASAVSGAFAGLLEFVRAAFNAGMNLLDSMLGAIASVVDTALSLVQSAITAVIETIGQALSRAAALAGSLLQASLNGIVIPLLNRIEASLIRLVDGAAQRATALLRENRNQYLASLAEGIAPPAGGSASEGNKNLSLEGRIAIVRQLGRDALQNYAKIVQTFETLTSNTSTLIIGTLTTFASRLFAGISTGLAQLVQAIVGAVSRIGQTLAELAQAIGRVIREIAETFAAALSEIVESLRSLVQGGGDQLIQFALSAVSRLGSFVASFVRNLILGRGLSASVTEAMGEFHLTGSTSVSKGPIVIPKPGPITIPVILQGLFLFLVVVGAIVLYAVPALAVVVTWLIAIGLNPYVALAVLAILALLVLALAAVLVWVLIKWLTKPKLPKPIPCTILTRTLLPAPDGTADTRTTVGVGEQVQMTSPSTATWSASRGKISPKIGITTTWTAPPTATVATVKAKLAAGGKPCVILMPVKAPDQMSMVKTSRNHPIPAGTAGACMVVDVTFHPLNVCLGAINWFEVPGPASNVKGYFKKFTRKQLFHNPTKVYLPVNDKNTGLNDHAASHSLAPPFSDGQFQWNIPNRYKLDGEPDSSGRFFLRTIQLFKIDASGTVTISKTNESVTRSP